MKSSTFELSLVIYIHEYLLNYSTLIMRRVLGSSAQRSTSLSRLIESVKSLSHIRVMKSLSLSCFMTECIAVFMSFSFEKLRSLDADVMVLSGSSDSIFWSRERSSGILSHNVLLLRSFLYLVCLLGSDL